MVEFALLSKNAIAGVATDRGQFDPHVEIQDRFWLYELERLPNQACAPLRIRYEDGTS